MHHNYTRDVLERHGNKGKREKNADWQICIPLSCTIDGKESLRLPLQKCPDATFDVTHLICLIIFTRIQAWRSWSRSVTISLILNWKTFKFSSQKQVMVTGSAQNSVHLIVYLVQQNIFFVSFFKKQIGNSLSGYCRNINCLHARYAWSHSCRRDYLTLNVLQTCPMQEPFTP